MIIRRSKLVAPAWQTGALETAAACGADALVLDTCFTVPESRRAEALAALTALSSAGKPPGLDVLAWIAAEDAAAVLAAGLGSLLDGVVVAVDSAQDVQAVDGILGTLEEGKRLPLGKVQLDLVIGSTRALAAVDALVRASPRVVSINLDGDGLAAEVGLEPSQKEDQLFYPRGRIIVASRVTEVQAHGLAFLPGEPGVAERARAARRLGLKGAFCWHPDDVRPQNQGFSYTDEEQEYARAQVEAMQEAERQGLGSVTLRGAMVDLAMYKDAQNVMDRAEAMARKEAGRAASGGRR